MPRRAVVADQQVGALTSISGITGSSSHATAAATAVTAAVRVVVVYWRMGCIWPLSRRGSHWGAPDKDHQDQEHSERQLSVHALHGRTIAHDTIMRLDPD